MTPGIVILAEELLTPLYTPPLMSFGQAAAGASPTPLQARWLGGAWPVGGEAAP